MVLHGRQTRTQKASYLDFFTSNTTTIDHDVRMLCATSRVANAGIDSKDVYCTMRTEFPPSIQDICQEKGRVGRIPWASANVFTYVICFDLDLYELLLRRTLNPEEKMTNSIRKMMASDHTKVAQLFTSINACFNHVFEHTMSNPFQPNTETPPQVDKCHHCPGCTRELERLYRRIIQWGAQDILFAAYTTTSTYSVNDLVLFISAQEDLNHRLFGRNRASIPKKRDIKLFIFRLIAWEIHLPQYIIDTKSITFIADKINQPTMFLFQSINAWNNIRHCF